MPPCVWITDTDVNPSYPYVLYLVSRPALLCSIRLIHLYIVLLLFTVMSAYFVVNLLYSITSEYA